MPTRSLLHWLLLCGAVACHSPQARLLLPGGSGAVALELDSVCRPELATFPLRLKLTNHTRHPVVLVFNALASRSHQAKNLYVTAGPDTFLLGIKGPNHWLVFPANTTTSFLGFGSFIVGKRPFHSFRQIDSVFRHGTLWYDFAPLVGGVDVAQPAPSVDTLLLPTKLEARTGRAVVVDAFLPGSYRWREKRLTLPERPRHRRKRPG